MAVLKNVLGVGTVVFITFVTKYALALPTNIVSIIEK